EPSPSRTTLSTVRRPGWAAQPRKPVPSYSKVNLRRRLGSDFGLLALPALSTLGRRVRRVVDELEVSHRCGVALPGPELDHPRVAARPVAEARRHLGEQVVHDLLRPEVGERLPPRVDRSVAP